MKVCLVTGGSRGIGAATAELFARQGYTVVVNYNHSQARAEDLRNRLAAEGCDVHLFKADVSSVEELSAMSAHIERYFKHLDVLVNNAGIALTKQLQDVAEAEFDKVFATNVKSAFFCAQYCLPLLRKVSGSIVNVSSIWGLRGAACESVYSASKHALVGLTKSLADELAPCSVRVNCVCPPIVQTDMCAHLTDADKSAFCLEQEVRVYTPQQVAQDIFTLATGKQTGQILLEK